MPQKPHATLDIETDPFKIHRVPEPFASAVFDGQTTKLFWGPACIIDLVDTCLKSSVDRIYYAHNGGKFDLHYLIPSLVTRFGSDNIKLLCIGTRLVQIHIPNVCEFRDSFAIIPKPLKSVGGKKLDIEIWKLEKSVNDLTGEQLERFTSDQKEKGVKDLCSPREFYKEEICRYLRRDCTGLHEAITEFFDLYGVNMTLASASFKVMQKQFGLKPPQSDEAFDSKFRKYYFAGHVEFFGLGEFSGEYKICDINSAFPAAMMENHWFSTSYIRCARPPIKNPERCFYKVRCHSKGALPWRTPNAGVTFPNIYGEFYATGWELLAGVELGLITRLEYLEIYMPTETQNFSAYIKHFYHLKQHAETEAERNFAKLFLNSYYGRLAINPREYRDVKITPFGDIPKAETKKVGKNEIVVNWEHSYDAEGFSFWQRPSNHGEKPMRFYNVATAASITGWVRAFLLRSMASCKGVLYCDTDSIIALDTSKLILGDGLGQWKLEMECDKVWIAGKKLYCARDKDPKAKKRYKTASKGVRLSPEQIISVALGNEEKFSFDAPNYSVYSPKRFTTRRVNRDDLRGRNKTTKKKGTDMARNKHAMKNVAENIARSNDAGNKAKMKTTKAGK